MDFWTVDMVSCHSGMSPINNALAGMIGANAPVAMDTAVRNGRMCGCLLLDGEPEDRRGSVLLLWSEHC